MSFTKKRIHSIISLYTMKKLTLLLFPILVYGTLLIPTTVVSAATPGCYVVSGSADRPNYSRETCTQQILETQTRIENICFIRGESATRYYSADCDSFDVGVNDNSSLEQFESSEPSQEAVGGPVDFKVEEGQYQCGTGENTVKTGLNLGCKGAAIEASGGEINPVLDMAFAFFRFLSAGVGLLVIGSIIYAGIQYSASRGNPQATEAAIKRVTSSLGALVLYIFLFALANYLVPGGMFI